MKISLLYPKGEGTSSSSSNAERIIIDLLLDESFSYFVPDVIKRRYFLSVVAEVQSDPNVPLYRAEILRDFCSKPNLFDGMCTALRELAALSEEIQADRSRFFTLVRYSDPEQLFANASGLAEVSSVATLKTLAKLKSLGELLCIYPTQSRGLAILKERIVSLTTGREYDEIIELLELTSHLSGDDTFTLHVALDDYARVKSNELAKVTHPIPVEETSGLKRLFAKKQNGNISQPGVKVADKWDVLRNDLLGGALKELAELTHAITQSVFDEFKPLLKELCFYEAAIAYVTAIRNKRIPLCYPAISDTEPAHFAELYDLHLCASYYNAGAVVPNDADLSHGGILVTGANNTGKTVFLRSIGTAQLLAQAGLPVTAKQASIRIRSGVWTLYAAAEKEFSAGNDAGRFEQEVRLVAEMFDSIKPGALVLLNELFQTTAYSEGAEGLCGILRYLRSEAVGSDYIAVTHLTDLIGMLAGEVVHMRTLEGDMLYKLEKVEDSRTFARAD